MKNNRTLKSKKKENPSKTLKVNTKRKTKVYTKTKSSRKKNSKYLYEGIGKGRKPNTWKVNFTALGTTQYHGTYNSQKYAAIAVNEKCVELGVEPKNPGLPNKLVHHFFCNFAICFLTSNFKYRKLLHPTT